MRKRRTKIEIELEKRKKDLAEKILDMVPDYVKKVMPIKKYLKFTEQQLIKHLYNLRKKKNERR